MAKLSPTKVKQRFRRAWLRKHGEASQGSYSRNNLSGYGDDAYSWERKLPSKGFSTASLEGVKRVFNTLTKARSNKAVATVLAKEAMQDAKRVRAGDPTTTFYGRSALTTTSRARGLTRKAKGKYASGEELTKKGSAQEKKALRALGDRYKRMWASRKRKYGPSGSSKRRGKKVA